VISNSGDDLEANDVFQEAVIIIYRKIKEGTLELNDCTFETYLISVCKQIWYKQRQKNKDAIVKFDDLNDYDEKLIDDDLTDLIRLNEKYKLFQDHFQKMGKDCQTILQLFFEKVPLNKVTEIMGYSSESYTKKRKHQCKEYLVRSIKQDSNFKNLIDYEL
jgi:RNA polymerase sigma factor (sigma-70 family)